MGTAGSGFQHQTGYPTVSEHRQNNSDDDNNVETAITEATTPSTDHRRRQ